jgi:hypothetical protein
MKALHPGEAESQRGNRDSRAGPFFAKLPGVVVFRATVFSIVLTFTAGPSFPLLCMVWCDPQAVTADGHRHDTGSETGSTINDAGDACCLDEILSPTVLTDGRWRQVSAGPALVVGSPKFRLPAPMLSDRPFDGSAPRPPTQKRPLSTPLRI